MDLARLAGHTENLVENSLPHGKTALAFILMLTFNIVVV